MATPVKFLFETSFDSAAGKKPKKRESADKAEIVSAPEVFTSADMKAATEQSFADGAREGAKQAGADLEAGIAQSLEQISTNVDILTAKMKQSQQQMGKEATELAMAIARKLSSTLAERAPLAEIESMIKSCLSEQHSEPKIVARVSEQFVGPITERIDRVANQSGFVGDLVLIPDNSLEGSACRVEWADGGAERNPRALEAAVNAAVHSFIEATFPNATSGKLDEPETGGPQGQPESSGET